MITLKKLNFVETCDKPDNELHVFVLYYFRLTLRLFCRKLLLGWCMRVRLETRLTIVNPL